jgi:hypothetical protein
MTEPEEEFDEDTMTTWAVDQNGVPIVPEDYERAPGNRKLPAKAREGMA